jgi:hypothetical protein
MNVEAFENLKRILHTLSADQLDMSNWNRCAIGHACHDAWFVERRLCTSFESARRIFGVPKGAALQLFSLRGGSTPDEVIASLDRFMRITAACEAERLARRQAIIDGMLTSVAKTERAARSMARAVVAAFGL